MDRALSWGYLVALAALAVGSLSLPTPCDVIGFFGSLAVAGLWMRHGE